MADFWVSGAVCHLLSFVLPARGSYSTRCGHHQVFRVFHPARCRAPINPDPSNPTVLGENNAACSTPKAGQPLGQFSACYCSSGLRLKRVIV